VQLEFATFEDYLSYSDATPMAERKALPLKTVLTDH